MYQYKHKNYISLCFYGIFLLILIVILGAYFPAPYFHVIADSEPGYFANIVSTYVNGYQADYMHPGVPVVYISSFFVSALPFNEDPEYLLLLSRVVLMVINFSLIYLGLLLLVKTSLLCTILFLSFLFIFPASNYYVDIVSANGILIGVGLIVCALGLKIGKPGSRKATLFWYSVSLAFAVSIKVQSILLVVPFLVASFFLKKNDASSTSPLFLVFLGSVTFFCFFGIFAFPILPMLPFWVTHFSDLYLFLLATLEGIKSASLLVFLGGLVFVIAIMSLAIRLYLPEKIKKFRSNTTYKAAYISMSSFFLLAVIYSLISVSLTGVDYNEIGMVTRNYLPFIGFIALFLPRAEEEEKIKLTTLIASVVLITLISVKGYQNQERYISSSKINLDFRSLIEESLTGSDHVVFYPVSSFISKDLFVLFSDYRYGERRIMFEEQADALPFRLDPKLKHMRLLNSRHFGSPKDVSSKFSYWYINKLLSLKYLPDVHREILENSKFYFKNKDICNEPYESFNHGDTFSLFVPGDLTYMEVESSYEFRKLRNMRIKTGNPYAGEFDKEPDMARKFIDELTNTWQNRCGFEILESKVRFVNNKNLFIIEISTKPNIKR
jgi:hypothetical protein